MMTIAQKLIWELTEKIENKPTVDLYFRRWNIYFNGGRYELAL